MSEHVVDKQKIFGIGFHKTGTKSLAAALSGFGYRVHGPGLVKDTHACASMANLQQAAWPLIDQFDAFQDNPWPVLWRELVAAFPDARFILTLRDEDAWFGSALRYFGEQQTPMRALIYGADAASPVGNEQRYRDRFRQHNQDVQQYFAGRDNFIALDVSSPDAYDRLCEFLGYSVTGQSFPHCNKG